MTLPLLPLPPIPREFFRPTSSAPSAARGSRPREAISPESSRVVGKVESELASDEQRLNGGDCKLDGAPESRVADTPEIDLPSPVPFNKLGVFEPVVESV